MSKDQKNELEMLDGTFTETSGPLVQKLITRDAISEEYSMSGRNIARLIRIDKLIDELKVLIDNGVLAVRSGVELSFLSKETQLEISELAEDYKIDMKKAKLLRESADNDGNVSNADIIRILDGKKNNADKGKSVKISNNIYSRYFEPTAKPKEIAETIEKALEMYFSCQV